MFFFKGVCECIVIPETAELTIFYERTYNQTHGNGDFIGNIHIETDKKKYVFHDVENVCSRCSQIVQQIFEQKDCKNIVVDLKNLDDACFTLFDERFTFEKT